MSNTNRKDFINQNSIGLISKSFYIGFLLIIIKFNANKFSSIFFFLNHKSEALKIRQLATCELYLNDFGARLRKFI